jgi:hypothetical protein
MRRKQPPSLTDPGRLERFLFSLGSSLAVTSWWTPLDCPMGFIGWRLGIYCCLGSPGCQPAELRADGGGNEDGWESEPGWFDAAGRLQRRLLWLFPALIWGRASDHPQGVEGIACLCFLLWERSPGWLAGRAQPGIKPSPALSPGGSTGGNQVSKLQDSISLKPGGKPGIRYSIFP